MSNIIIIFLIISEFECIWPQHISGARLLLHYNSGQEVGIGWQIWYEAKREWDYCRTITKTSYTNILAKTESNTSWSCACKITGRKKEKKKLERYQALDEFVLFCFWFGGFLGIKCRVWLRRDNLLRCPLVYSMPPSKWFLRKLVASLPYDNSIWKSSLCLLPQKTVATTGTFCVVFCALPCRCLLLLLLFVLLASPCNFKT